MARDLCFRLATYIQNQWARLQNPQPSNRSFVGRVLFLLYFSFLSFGAFQPENYFNPACWIWGDYDQISVTLAIYHLF